MNRLTLLVLLGVTVTLAAIWLLAPQKNAPNDSQFLFPGLKDQLNDIDKVVVSVGGDRRVATLERGEDQWRVTERFGYPANVARIRQNMIALADATIVERKTSNPDLYGRLGIEDPGLPGANGYLLEIFPQGQGESEPVGLIVGDTGVRGNMAYVRRPGEDQGLMISADFDLGKETADWLAGDLMDIASADIRSITITHPDGEIVQIEKSDPTDANFLVLDLPEGRELQYDSIANPIAGLLTKLRMDDVLPADSIDRSLSRPIVSRFETFDGLVVEASIYETDGGAMVGFTVIADVSQAARADELNARLESWVYSLPSFKSEQLGKRLNDFLKTDDE